MTPISINTYPEGQHFVIEISWRDWIMRRDAGVQGVMTKAKIAELIAELQELIK